MMLQNFNATIHPITITKEYIYEDTTLITLTAKSFQVNLENTYAQKNINEKIENETRFFINYVNNEIFPLAVENFNQSQNNDYPFHTFDAIKNYEITYNQNCHLSFYSDEYLFTGGAHGNTTRRSTTFNLKTGKPVSLGYFFKGGNYIKVILDEIIRQADEIEKEYPMTFFDGYPQLIVKYFNINSFYLTNDGLVIYYQQYEIAPYSSGIRIFLIPFEMLNFLPKC